LIFADSYLFVALAQKTQQKSVHKQSPKSQQQTLHKEERRGGDQEETEERREEGPNSLMLSLCSILSSPLCA
jgi:hypothetical protein